MMVQQLQPTCINGAPFSTPKVFLPLNSNRGDLLLVAAVLVQVRLGSVYIAQCIA
jgi:hypothetical protein